ncbi:MAG: ABC transporter ATP-binding protein [Chloroflexi bacterium]|nr:ABC transporter ATP-binding protein [Chloroflexota bacterium]
MSTFAVRCNGLTKRYGEVAAVEGVDLAVQPGEILSIVGPSGSGKTTTLRLIAGFESIDAGEISLRGEVVSGLKTHVPPERRRVGIVFQEHALFPHKTVGENVAFGLHKLGASERSERLREALELVRLTHLERRYPHELSGGEQQRVALARALAPNPAVLLLDEPFSNLDADLRARIRGEVKSILADAGVTVVFVTHDQDDALFMGDRIAIINEGRIEQSGTPEQVFHEPETRFAAGFLGVADFLPAEYSNGTVKTELGSFPMSGESSGLCEVMTRPDDIEVTRSPEGSARVLSRTFQGISDLYVIELPSGAVVRAERPHHKRFEPGDSVRVTVAPHYVARCFAQADGKLMT